MNSDNNCSTNSYKVGARICKSFIVTLLYKITFRTMLVAKEAARLIKEMSPEDRFAAVRNKVADKTQAVLDQKIREVIAACGNKVDVVL